MTFGQRVALNIAPLLLRLGLAFIFIYYGASKLFYADMPVQGADAAYLANAGLVKAPPRPAVPMPGGDEGDRPEGEPPAQGEGEGVVLLGPVGPAIILAQNAQEPAGDEPVQEPEEPVIDEPDVEPPAPPGEEAEPEPIDEAPDGTAPAPEYSASDFAEPIRVRRLFGLVLTMHHAAEQGRWPDQLASPTLLHVLAWVGALTEFLGGWLVLLGFLTRVWALGFAVVMCAAMWLTQIAPSIGADGALLGFLPPLRIADAEEWDAWETWHFQTILLMASLAVLLAGPGRFSLDALLFRRPARRVSVRTPPASE